MPTIFDINQFRVLKPFCEGTRTRLTLHGGTAFRFALRTTALTNYSHAIIDLFDLTPFTADVDLLHSGPTSATAGVREYILWNVSNADCFRWEIRSEESQKIFNSALAYAPSVPARRISLGSNGLLDPEGGVKDIEQRQFRYLRNRWYQISPLYMSGRDLEIFSALLYMQTLFEADVTIEEAEKQPGRENASAVFADAIEPARLNRLIEDHYLKTRTIYLVINSRYWTTSLVGFKKVCVNTGFHRSSLLPRHCAVASSASRSLSLVGIASKQTIDFPDVFPSRMASVS
jgi:hypothetical protein